MKLVMTRYCVNRNYRLFSVLVHLDNMSTLLDRWLWKGMSKIKGTTTWLSVGWGGYLSTANFCLFVYHLKTIIFCFLVNPKYFFQFNSGFFLLSKNIFQKNPSLPLENQMLPNMLWIMIWISLIHEKIIENKHNA